MTTAADDDGWTLGTGTQVRMRLAPGTTVDEVRAAGFDAVVMWTTQPPPDWPSPSAFVRGPWAEATARGGRVAKGHVLELAAVSATSGETFPVLPSPALARVIGETPTQPEVSRTASTPWGYYETLVELAKRHGWDALGMMQIQWSESNIQPGAKHRNATGQTVAVGLIQFNGSLPGLGWTNGNDRFAELSAVDQLPFVELYYARKPMPIGANGTAFYLANYEPAKLAHWTQPSYVLDRARDGTGFYEAQQAAFDPERKGYITVGDLAARLDRVCVGPTWGEHVARLRWALDAWDANHPSTGVGAAAVAVAMLVAGAATWAYVQGAPPWISILARRSSHALARARRTLSSAL